MVNEYLFEEELPRLTEHRGIVGDRHLVAVQTFDIARLTTHAVPVVPETFVAVSGMGPKEDSNGSGKTSFLIAVSLLLADPQWRFESNHGLYASGILFKPEAAGVDRAQQMPAATHGYVVGVFTGAESDPAADALTVWVRLAASAPYVQANWTEGIHVADASTDAERAVQADDRWQELGADRILSVRRMAEELYGNAPRCLTYLDTPLRPAVPSLLSQQLTAMEPHEIGEALIALSGMTHLLEQEAARRGKALEHARELEKVQADHAQTMAEGEAVLEGVRARALARAALEEGRRAWQRFVASSCLQSVRADQKLGAELDDKNEQVCQAQDLVGQARSRFDKLRAAADLAGPAGTARQAWSDAKQITEEASAVRTSAATTQGLVRQEMAGLRPQSSLWRGASAADARAVLEEARGGLYGAQRQAEDAHRAVGEARELMTAVEQGRSGAAGQALEALAAERITALGLMDQLQLEESARAAWEPRLWAWRDAVVVPHEWAERAREMLRSLPGAQVIAADADDAVGVRPQGVRSRMPLTGFLNTLHERMSTVDEPLAVCDPSLSLTVLGGFDAPVAGRAARLVQARAHLEQCRSKAGTADAGVGTAEAQLEIAQIEYDAAVAAQRLAALQVQDAELTAAVAAADMDVTAARGTEEKLQGAWERAQGALSAHQERVLAAQLTLDMAVKAHKERLRENGALEKTRAEIACPAWLQLWGASVEEAAELLGMGDVGTPVPRPGRLRREVEDQLRIAYGHYGLPDGALAAAEGDLRLAGQARARFAEEDPSALPGTSFDNMALPLQIRLDGYAERDTVVAAQIAADRALSEQALAELTEGAENSARTLETLQDMIEQHIDGLLTQINDAFDALDRQRGGDGARLEKASVRPEGAMPWRWEVTPHWKRSARGGYVHYRENANGAQVKVYAIQLVLAALLADAETRGRVLILDELGNSLGEVNRKDMLAALRNVARRQQLTILGTCQDSVLVDAADVCDELLWFTHAASSDAYNQPTRAWGYDPNAQRVELTADWITAGRSHA